MDTDKMTVRTWADGYGTWHAAVTTPDLNRAGTRGVARDAIAGELTERGTADPAWLADGLYVASAGNGSPEGEGWVFEYVEADKPAAPSFEDGIEAVEWIAAEHGVEFRHLRWWASDRLAEMRPEGEGISSSDVNHHLAGLGNNDRELVVAEAQRLAGRAALIKQVADGSGLSLAEAERQLGLLFAPREDPA